MVLIFLYSKYSENCKKLIKIIESYKTPINIKYICIDHKKIRQAISKSEKLKINLVPCLLTNTDDNLIYKYEGSKCFDFIISILEQIQSSTHTNINTSINTNETVKSISTTQITNDKSEEQLRHDTVNDQHKNRNVTSIENIEYDENSNIESSIASSISKKNIMDEAKFIQKEREAMP